MKRRIYSSGTLLELYDENGALSLFTLKESLGSGASCVAYRAVTEDGIPVKLKQFCPRDPEPGSRTWENAERRFLDACGQQRAMLADQNLVNITSGLLAVYRDSDDLVWSAVNDSAGETLEQYFRSHSLQECIGILRQVMESIRAYHRAGWLLLDLKPENILVIDSPGIRGVNFFDFDSFLRMEDLQEAIHSGTELQLSSSPVYSAPELQRAPIPLELIGPSADLFSLGAMCFQAVFGRMPDTVDCLPGARYDYGRCSPDRKREMNRTIRDRISLLLSRTMAFSPDDRFPDDDTPCQILRDLDQIHLQPQLELLVPPPVPGFTGRAEELARLKKQLDGGSGPIFVSGIGGIGKTQLVLKLAETCRENWQFCFTGFRGNIRDTLLNLSFENLSRTQMNAIGEEIPIPEDALYRKILEVLRTNTDHRTVLIIDNFDAEPEEKSNQLLEDPELKNLLMLPLRVIFTSRCHFDRIDTLDVSSLGEEELLGVMKGYLPAAYDGELRELIRALSLHTLSVDIAARTMKESRGTITPRRMLQHLKSSGGDIPEHLAGIFRVAKLSADAGNILAFACLFPLRGVDSGLLRSLVNDSEWKAAENLERCGWLRYDAQSMLWSMHPLVRTVCEKDDSVRPDKKRVKPYVDALLRQERENERLREDPALHGQINEVLANHARLPDPSPPAFPLKRILILLAAFALTAAAWVWMRHPDPGPAGGTDGPEASPAVTESFSTAVPGSDPAQGSDAETGNDATPDSSAMLPEPTRVPSETGPGPKDLDEIHSGIEYPREEEYLDEYAYATVVSEKGHSVFGYGDAGMSGNSFTVLDGELVEILAVRKDASCVIVLSQNNARWIRTSHLQPAEAPD